MTDALLAAVPGADIAINNSGGGLRADLPAGPLTYGSVFEVMPFDNLLVRLRLTGRRAAPGLLGRDRSSSAAASASPASASRPGARPARSP